MLRSISWQQWEEWKVYMELAPFSPERLEEVISKITWVLLNVHRAKGSSAVEWPACTPRFGDFPQAVRKPWQYLDAALEEMAASQKKDAEEKAQKRKKKGRKLKTGRLKED